MAERIRSCFERFCRLCAEEQDVTIKIFSDEADAMLLQNKLKKYLLIQIAEDDMFPKNICVNCCTKLEAVCDFIDKVKEAQDFFTKGSSNLSEMKQKKIDIQCKSDHETYDKESKTNEMEVSVDPMMVLQNCDEELSGDNLDNNFTLEDVTHLHDVDENVTIKLIRNAENKSNDEETSKPYSCKICKRGFFTDLALKNHSWIHITETSNDYYTCSTCNEVFELKNDFLTHLKKHKILKGLCQLCGRMFRSEKTYTDHMMAHQSTNNSFSCKICGHSYKTWGSLRIHSVTHSSERPYICQYCKKTFKRKQDLKFHINQHTGEKPYKCPFCEKCFASSGNCYSHRNRMHPGKSLTGNMKRWNGQPKENQVKIKNTAEAKSKLTNVKGIYKYKCEFCDHSFLRRDNFTYHMYKHTGQKPFQCSFCPEKFVTRKGVLIHHDNTHPSKERPLSLLTKNVLLM